jgi:DNA-binding NarL/FixJ family response regulator
MKSKKLLIVEDSEVVRTRIRAVASALPEIEVVAEAGDAAGAIQQVDKHRPDFITLDLQLDNESHGADVLKYLNDRSLSPVVIVLSANVCGSGTESAHLPGASFILDKVMEFHHLHAILWNAVRANRTEGAPPDDDGVQSSHDAVTT